MIGISIKVFFFLFLANFLHWCDKLDRVSFFQEIFTSTRQLEGRMCARTKFARLSTAQVSGNSTNQKVGRFCLYKALPAVVASTFALRASSKKGWVKVISFSLLQFLHECFPISTRCDFLFPFFFFAWLRFSLTKFPIARRNQRQKEKKSRNNHDRQCTYIVHGKRYKWDSTR